MNKIRVKTILKSFIMIFFIVLFVMGFFIEPDEIVVHKVTLKVQHWDKEHDNLKIAVISDIHAGAPFIGNKKLKKIVELTNREKPDLILLPGDFVEKRVIGGLFIKPDVTANILSNLKSKYGMVAVLGNHDWDYNGKEVESALEKGKISVLENNVKELMVNGKPLWIAGLADLTRRFPDIDDTMARIKGKKTSILMLSHNPDVFPFVPKSVSLTLSGHTHGGQVRFPIVGRLIVPSIFAQRYAYGYVHENNKDLYVSAGIGTSRLPVRFGVLPEIVILTLKSK